ncbi:unnamed protein product [Fraxinus pennsylvanica]|uniref:Uncharacterized protein n=1 Tax=Fraxinus pennsylvanica TaxID=56036 RepID=A0AAD2E7E1_9LAMI|nr:unnamed protein product [Fraxinus pennsylvanica]
MFNVLKGLDTGLALVLESLEFCLQLRGSEACVLEDLTKAINLVHVRRGLVESGHALLNHAHHAQQEYERYYFYPFLYLEWEPRIFENMVAESAGSPVEVDLLMLFTSLLIYMEDEERGQRSTADSSVLNGVVTVLLLVQTILWMFSSSVCEKLLYIFFLD